MALVGWVETASEAGIAGWAGDTMLPTQPVEVDIYVSTRCIGRAVADRYRHDLQVAGYGDGRKAFYYPFSKALIATAEPIDVRVCFADTNQLVPNGAFTLNAVVAGGDGSNPWNAGTPYDYSTLWLGSKPCRDHIYRAVSGNPDLHPLNYFIEKYIVPRGPAALKSCRALLLGASEGYMERELCKAGFTGEIISTDIADVALQRARAKSQAEGFSNIRHVVQDLNEPFGSTFGGEFDFIFAEGVLHHIANISQCLEECHRVLKPDGFMFALEFEGPFRFQLPDLQLQWINAALNAMPRGLRPLPDKHEPQFPASAKESSCIPVLVAKEEAIARMDPSEALTGPELKRLLPQVFNVVERTGFGGTLLSYMTCHFDFKRSNTDPYVARWLKVLMEIEHALIDTGILDDEFVFYVLKSRPGRQGLAK